MVSFIGAGPGDPELLTIKGKKLIDSADVIIYAGSLVNPEVLRDAKPDAAIYNSAGMTLEEVLAVMKDGEEKGAESSPGTYGRSGDFRSAPGADGRAGAHGNRV